MVGDEALAWACVCVVDEPDLAGAVAVAVARKTALELECRNHTKPTAPVIACPEILMHTHR